MLSFRDVFTVEKVLKIERSVSIRFLHFSVGSVWSIRSKRHEWLLQLASHLNWWLLCSKRKFIRVGFVVESTHEVTNFHRKNVYSFLGHIIFYSRQNTYWILSSWRKIESSIAGRFESICWSEDVCVCFGCWHAYLHSRRLCYESYTRRKLTTRMIAKGNDSSGISLTVALCGWICDVLNRSQCSVCD